MGIYAGVLVVLVAVWGVTQSFQKKGSALRSEERKQIWCWLTLLVVSILLAWGRHAPFYRIAYALPYLSTIRNPIKFIFPFSLALVILFGYGLEGLPGFTWTKPALQQAAGGIKSKAGGKPRRPSTGNGP